MTKKAKIILYTSLSTITIASVSTAVTIMLLKNKNKRTNNSKENNQKQNNDNKNNENNKEPEINDVDPKAIYQNSNLKEVNSDDIFPVVNSNDYYDKLNFRNGQAWIDDDMIAFIIKDIISRMTITNGNIKYAYNKISDQVVEIYFIWYSKTQKAFRNYKIHTNTI